MRDTAPSPVTRTRRRRSRRAVAAVGRVGSAGSRGQCDGRRDGQRLGGGQRGDATPVRLGADARPGPGVRSADGHLRSVPLPRCQVTPAQDLVYRALMATSGRYLSLGARSCKITSGVVCFSYRLLSLKDVLFL